MRFIKMHGIGNDYVYVNGFTEPVARDDAALAALARRISNRHTGVGGDGLILVVPPEPGVDAHVRMRMFNADGSESEMCGNGVRCVCKLAHDHDLPGAKANPMRVQTGRGVLSLQWTTPGSGPDSDKVNQVTVDMGEPILRPADIPVAIPDLPRLVNHPTRNLITWADAGDTSWVKRSGLDQRMTCVSMGNPHIVFYCDDVAVVPLEQVGPMIEHHKVFPKRINVHFVQTLAEGEAVMRTWERGSGITLACGTGACAVCVAGVLTGRTDRRLLAHLPGGDLTLRWDASSDHVFMTGPATEVFTGEWRD